MADIVIVTLTSCCCKQDVPYFAFIKLFFAFLTTVVKLSAQTSASLTLDSTTLHHIFSNTAYFNIRVTRSNFHTNLSPPDFPLEFKSQSVTLMCKDL